MKFTKKVLENGLTILHEKRDVPVTTVMIAVRYGAAYENVQEKGIAHFMEHLCFKGTQKRTVDDIAQEVEGLGGELNAFTHEEVTAYHVKLPSEHAKVAMDVMFDVFFNPTYPEEEIAKEAQVICEEIKMYKDNPHRHVMNQIKENLFTEPLGGFIAGSEKTVRSMTREQLLKKNKEWYTPANTILTVVGNNDFEEIETLAKKLCPDIEGKAQGEVKVEKRFEKTNEKRKDLTQTNLAIGFHFPKAEDKDVHAAEIFSQILGEGMSSKLFIEVREKRGLVYGIVASPDIGKNYGYMIIWAGTDPSNKDEVIAVSLEEFAKMKEVTEEELKAAKTQALGRRQVQGEQSDHTAAELLFSELHTKAEDYYKYEEHIKAVKLEDIHKLAEKTEHALFWLGP